MARLARLKDALIYRESPDGDIICSFGFAMANVVRFVFKIILIDPS
jgi:hypothetical protein